MLSSIGGGIDARPPTARARYPCPFRLATSLCENPALAQKLIGRHHLAQSRLMAAVAAVAVGVISAHQLAVASMGGGCEPRPRTARARYPCPFRLATWLCENPALAQKLIGRHHLAQSRLMAAVAAVAVGVISAHQLAVAATQRRAVGTPLQPQ